MEYAPDYTPDFEIVKKGLGSCGPKFQKLQARKVFYKVSSATSDNFFNYDDFAKNDNTSKYSKRVQTPHFKKMRSRAFNPRSPLPSFMQKSINTRGSLMGLSQKMLERNSYMGGKFQTIVSGFGLKKFKKKKIEFEDDDFFDPEFLMTR